ncbi:MAG: helix-turn-helix transcriptional regulator [Cellvibrionaceae bacterium]
METKASQRLKALRLLMGFKQEEIANLLDIPAIRYKNVEIGRVKISEDEYSGIGKALPALLPWLVYSGPINLEELKVSDNANERLVAAAIESGRIPTGYEMENSLIAD